MPLILELEQAYEDAKRDPAFDAELQGWFKDYVGRPSPLYFAERLTDHLGGAKIYFKRDELNHTGAHKINNVLGQMMLARRMGKTADHRRDRRRPARRGDRHGGRALRPGMHRLHGRARHRAAAAQRVPHEAAGRRGAPGELGLAHAQGRAQRGAARLGQQPARHLLRHRHGGRPAPLSGHGARLPVDHRHRGQGAAAGEGRPAARRAGGGRRRRLQRHGPVPPVPRRPRRADRRGRGRRPRHRHRRARGGDDRRAGRASCTASAPTCCRTRTAR